MNNEILIAENRNLAVQVLEQARKRNLRIGTAESCTGGMISSFLTAIPGSSDCFTGAIVSYWAEVKNKILGVPNNIIREYGVVSEEVARAMAIGASQQLECDIAVSTTGIAGPGGAEPGKPVGTVCFGIQSPNRCKSITICEGNSRDEVRLLATCKALQLLLDTLQTL